MDALVSISDFDALVDRLGGREKAIETLNLTFGRFNIYKHRGGFPSRLYHAHAHILAGIGISVAPSLYGQVSFDEWHGQRERSA